MSKEQSAAERIECVEIAVLHLAIARKLGLIRPPQTAVVALEREIRAAAKALDERDAVKPEVSA